MFSLSLAAQFSLLQSLLRLAEKLWFFLESLATHQEGQVGQLPNGAGHPLESQAMTWLVSSSHQLASASSFSCRAIAQIKPTSSLATAVIACCEFLPLDESFRYWR